MLFLLLACAPKPVDVAPVAPVAAPALATGPSPDAVRIHMSLNFAKAVAARTAVVGGKVGDAQARLAELAAATDPALIGEDGVPYLAALKAAAQSGATATTAVDLGTTIGSVSASCGACHTHVTVRLSPVVASAPPAGAGHAAAAGWLVDALWTGVVANADTAWASGASALAGSPKDAAGYGVASPGPAAQASLATLAAQVAAAPLAQTATARAEVLGKVVGACGSCHAEHAAK